MRKGNKVAFKNRGTEGIRRMYTGKRDCDGLGENKEKVGRVGKLVMMGQKNVGIKRRG